MFLKSSALVRTGARRRVGVLLATTVSLLAAACGSSGNPPEAGPAEHAAPARTPYPLTLTNCGRKVTFDKPPERVLIMNGVSVGEVQTYLLLGLQSRIIANAQRLIVADDPTMVARVAALPTGGAEWNKSFDVPAEKVLELKPDLVVSTWSGGFNADSGFATRDQLSKAGINSFVNPVDCAYGATDPSEADQAAYDQQSITSSYEFIRQTGVIFDQQQKAADVVAGLEKRIAAVRARVAGQERKKVLISYPGMSVMSANKLPAVFSGGVYDDVIDAAGGVNAFPSDKPNPDLTSTLNAEALAAADVDVLVIGLTDPSEKGKEGQFAEQLFRQYPQWEASRTKTYTSIADAAFLGPANVFAVEKIADAAHPR